ncbi:hypothetical protein EYF80_051229 [Liparis tanakae]|uniref:Uncharacterized protein n=1 Tax=Liparis tanakae TaxID=230148 RepID=A0A4Z2FBH1_9TELE|nr:hypothetical protein EYF80_051229 [Liparis tanakae]
MRPLRGYRLKILAALVLVTPTNWFSSILPVTWREAKIETVAGEGGARAAPGPPAAPEGVVLLLPSPVSPLGAAARPRPDGAAVPGAAGSRSGEAAPPLD